MQVSHVLLSAMPEKGLEVPQADLQAVRGFHFLGFSSISQS
jgi:hypothetical protein